MSFTSLLFYFFIAISLIFYYVMPLKKRWVALLVASIIFYASLDIRAVVFVTGTAITVYYTTVNMGKISSKYKAMMEGQSREWLKENKRRLNRENKAEKKKYLVAGLLVNVGVLFVVKYLPAIVNGLTGMMFPQSAYRMSILLPLGISFYTFQAVGYMVDVFYEKVTPEKNFLKLFLFLTFFPQIIQGPISKAGQLMPKLTEGNRLKFDNIKFGSQLILWGLLKKLIIADIISGFATAIMSAPENFTGFQGFVGYLAAYIQLYGDFSGGIDITRGVAQLFGIDMTLNFKRPFFATSITDYWRRWHVSLGNFMKDYVMMPLNLSKPLARIGKWGRDKFGVNIGKLFPVFVSSFFVFLLVGVWHGPNMKYIVFGAMNGLMVSTEAVINAVKKPKEHGIIYKTIKYAAALVYTEVTLFFINSVSLCPTLTQSAALFRKVLTDFHIMSAKTDILMLIETTGIGIENFIMVFGIFAVVLFVEFLQEIGFEIRKTIDKQNILVIYAVYLAIIFVILLYSANSTAPGGFAYAGF